MAASTSDALIEPVRNISRNERVVEPKSTFPCDCGSIWFCPFTTTTSTQIADPTVTSRAR